VELLILFSKVTTFLAIVFLGNSVYLAKIQSTKNTSSLLDSEAPIARPLNQDAKKSEVPSSTVPATTPKSNTDKK